MAGIENCSLYVPVATLNTTFPHIPPAISEFTAAVKLG